MVVKEWQGAWRFLACTSLGACSLGDTDLIPRICCHFMCVCRERKSLRTDQAESPEQTDLNMSLNGLLNVMMRRGTHMPHRARRGLFAGRLVGFGRQFGKAHGLP